MGRAKKLKTVRKLVGALKRDAETGGPEYPVVRWYHHVPIFGRWLWRRGMAKYAVQKIIQRSAVNRAARRTYQANK